MLPTLYGVCSNGVLYDHCLFHVFMWRFLLLFFSSLGTFAHYPARSPLLGLLRHWRGPGQSAPRGRSPRPAVRLITSQVTYPVCPVCPVCPVTRHPFLYYQLVSCFIQFNTYKLRFLLLFFKVHDDRLYVRRPQYPQQHLRLVRWTIELISRICTPPCCIQS